MLNTEHFVVLAGNTAKWDAEFAKCRPGKYSGTFNSDDVCAVQARQARAGFRSAKLCETVYGWSVRDGSGLNNFAIMASRMTKAEAIRFGTDWANADPDNREFFAHKSDVSAIEAEHLLLLLRHANDLCACGKPALEDGRCEICFQADGSENRA